MAMHQSTAVNDPPCPRDQMRNTQTHVIINLYHHPHRQEAEVYSMSCNSCGEENEPYCFFALHLCTTSSDMLIDFGRSRGGSVGMVGHGNEVLSNKNG
jgi:hypothetical protein